MSPPSPTSEGPDPAEAFRRLGSIAEALGQVDCQREITSSVRAAEAGRLRVAVVGQFKRGKSTLLNAIVGAEVLPAGVLPLTSVATEIREGPGEMWVYASRADPFLGPLASLPEYATELGNPENAKRIERVELRIPLPAWARDVVFRDTPGVGSIHAAASREAVRLLSEVDAAVFVVSPDPPISAVELDFLREVADQASKFFFVLNKVDLLDGPDLEAAAAYVRSALRDRAGFPSPKLYRCSARRALGRVAGTSASDPGVRDLVADLAAYLGRDRVESIRSATARRVERIARRLLAADRLARAAFREERSAFATAMQRLEEAGAELVVEQRAADALLEDDLVRLLLEIEPLFAEYLTRETPRLTEAIAGRLETVRARSGARFVREFDTIRRELVLPGVAELRARLERRVTEGLDEAGRRYARRIRELLAGVDRSVAEVFHLEIPPLDADVNLVAASSYRVRTDALLEDTFAGQTLQLVPAALLRGRLRSRLGTILAEELDGQVGRIRSDLVERSERTVRSFRLGMDEQLRRSREALRTAAETGQAAASADPRAREEWAQRLDGWEADLEQLLRAGARSPAPVIAPSTA